MTYYGEIKCVGVKIHMNHVYLKPVNWFVRYVVQ